MDVYSLVKGVVVDCTDERKFRHGVVLRGMESGSRFPIREWRWRMENSTREHYGFPNFFQEKPRYQTFLLLRCKMNE